MCAQSTQRDRAHENEFRKRKTNTTLTNESGKGDNIAHAPRRHGPGASPGCAGRSLARSSGLQLQAQTAAAPTRLPGSAWSGGGGLIWYIRFISPFHLLKSMINTTMKWLEVKEKE